MGRTRSKRRQPPPAAARADGWWWPWALALGTVLLYWPSVGEGLTNWDDPEYVTHNPFAAQGLHGLWAAVSQPFDGAWYPVTQAVYVLLRASGASLTAMHLVQVLVFAAGVALVPRALEAFGVPRAAGAVAAVLWAVHPLRVESVAWLANLKDTLGVGLLLGAFALYGARRRWPALACFVAALLAKSAFLGAGLLFPLVDVLRGDDWKLAARRAWPWLTASVAVALVAGALHQAGPAARDALPFSQRLATALWTPWWYLARTAVPQAPRAIYDFTPVALGEPRFFAALGLWVALLGLTWKRARVPDAVRRGVLVVAAAVVVALAPVGGLVPLRFLVADRYTLLTSLAVFAGLVALAWRTLPRVAVVLAAAVLAIPFAAGSLRYQAAWRDSISLWERTLESTPEHPTVRMNLADAYLASRQPAKARAQTMALLERRPDDSRVLTQLYVLSGIVDGVPPGELDTRRARLETAWSRADVVLDEADWCLAHTFLACASALLDYPASLRESGRALRMRSAVARGLGRLDAATELARQALAHGEPAARVELVYALADGGHPEDALRESQQPMPDAFSAALLRGARGYVLSRIGRVDEGRAESAAAIEEIRRLSSEP